MGALFRIERSAGAGIAQDGPTALEAVRRALALLQQQPTNHPAVQVAMEAVAGSLSLVHRLATEQAPAAAPSPQAAYQQPPQPAYQQQPQAAYQQTALAQPPAYVAPPVQQAPAPYVSQKVDAAYQPTMALEQAPVAAAPPQARQAPISPGSAPRVEAELGAHSPSNFYKGLSGSDVVDHGGLFVATFQVPRIGQPVALHVSLPGGYEFEALGVVRWTREPLDAGESGTQPGFGAQFTQISPEARQLVYRYVRNREPLFHDDL
jgi:Tfp pilus assembly protein PilZ